jgi:GTP-binding protein HflX
MSNPQSFDSKINNNSPVANANGGADDVGRSRRTVVRDTHGLVSTAPAAEIAVLVGVDIDSMPSLLTLEDSLDELALLAKTADLQVAGRMTQRLASPNPATLIGSGKLEELKLLVIELGANVVIFDDELSPRQQRELEKVLGDEVKVIDRTALILDIFASHARTREGAVQVELAQYEYRLPRLTRAWTHLARQAGGRAGGASGGVGVRGPGETQLEADRREIGRRIAFLKRQLEDIVKHRDQYRAQRRELAAPVIAVVGYTNAGKSTLLNAISRADVLAEDKLFATLDPTTRRVELPSDRMALFSDTVGFIQKLPTQLVAAFRSTLEEVTEADMLLHVVDLSHPNMEEQVAAVEEVLDELGAGDKLVVVALNKLDRLDLNDPAQAQHLAAVQAEHSQSVAISALTGRGIDDLLATVDRVLKHHMAAVDVLIPYQRGELVSLMHEHGVVEHEEHTEHGTHLRGRLPVELAGRFAPYWVQEEVK